MYPNTPPAVSFAVMFPVNSFRKMPTKLFCQQWPTTPPTRERPVTFMYPVTLTSLESARAVPTAPPT